MKRHFVARFGPMTQDELNTELVSMFAKADADGSGLIEKHELMFLMEKEINITLPERDFLRLYNKYDEDKSGEIDFHEFLGLITDLLSESEQEVHTSHPEIQSPTKAMNVSKLNALHLMEASDNLLNPTREDVVVYSLWCLAPTNPLRVAATWLTMQPRFEHFILVCIFYSSVTLALDQPLLPDTHALRPFLVELLKKKSACYGKFVEGYYCSGPVGRTLVLGSIYNINTLLNNRVLPSGPLQSNHTVNDDGEVVFGGFEVTD